MTPIINLPECILANPIPKAQLEDWKDCTRSGNCEEACLFILDQYNPKFLGTSDEIKATARTIYCDSETDFNDLRTAKMYLIWETAFNELS